MVDIRQQIEQQRQGIVNQRLITQRELRQAQSISDIQQRQQLLQEREAQKQQQLAEYNKQVQPVEQNIKKFEDSVSQLNQEIIAVQNRLVGKRPNESQGQRERLRELTLIRNRMKEGLSKAKEGYNINPDELRSQAESYAFKSVYRSEVKPTTKTYYQFTTPEGVTYKSLNPKFIQQKIRENLPEGGYSSIYQPVASSSKGGVLAIDTTSNKVVDLTPKSKVDVYSMLKSAEVQPDVKSYLPQARDIPGVAIGGNLPYQVRGTMISKGPIPVNQLAYLGPNPLTNSGEIISSAAKTVGGGVEYFTYNILGRFGYQGGNKIVSYKVQGIDIERGTYVPNKPFMKISPTTETLSLPTREQVSKGFGTVASIGTTVGVYYGISQVPGLFTLLAGQEAYKGLVKEPSEIDKQIKVQKELLNKPAKGFTEDQWSLVSKEQKDIYYNSIKQNIENLKSSKLISYGSGALNVGFLSYDLFRISKYVKGELTRPNIVSKEISPVIQKSVFVSNPVITDKGQVSATMVATLAYQAPSVIKYTTDARELGNIFRNIIKIGGRSPELEPLTYITKPSLRLSLTESPLLITEKGVIVGSFGDGKLNVPYFTQQRLSTVKGSPQLNKEFSLISGYQYERGLGNFEGARIKGLVSERIGNRPIPNDVSPESLLKGFGSEESNLQNVYIKSIKEVKVKPSGEQVVYPFGRRTTRIEATSNLISQKSIIRPITSREGIIVTKEIPLPEGVQYLKGDVAISDVTFAKLKSNKVTIVKTEGLILKPIVRTSAGEIIGTTIKGDLKQVSKGLTEQQQKAISNVVGLQAKSVPQPSTPRLPKSLDIKPDTSYFEAPTIVGGLGRTTSIYAGTGRDVQLTNVGPLSISPGFKSIEDNKITNLPYQNFDTKISTIEGTNTITKIKSVQTPKISIDTKTDMKENIDLATDQFTKQNQRVETLQDTKMDQVSSLTTITQLGEKYPVIPNIPIKKKKKLDLDNKVKSTIDNLVKGFKTFYVRRGKKEYLSGVRTKSEALKIGEEKVLRGVAATFGVEETSALVTGTNAQYTPSEKIFRSYKIRGKNKINLKDTFIQRTSYEGGLKGGRLSFGSEVAELTSFKRKKGGFKFK